MAFLSSVTGKEAPAEQIDAYHEMLGHLPFDVLKAAAKRAAGVHQFPTIPPVGLILQHARDLADPPLPAGEAWELACQAVRAHGLDGEARGLTSLPPRVAAAVRAYGWRAICDCPRSNAGTVFAQFRQVYESIDTAARTEAAMPPALRLPPAVGRAAAGIGAMPEARLRLAGGDQ